ncbi:hypothetical protein GWK47_035046 [Chionoecetes opilio]|uniref:Uncharacterized protein n=1 Tax=Chionoecetes opilio TaxID=41210 RepID=A0A8J4YUC2_CHIOP|nr:hypothetical protein GWK47_035046 [Chionoecetes opilio]
MVRCGLSDACKGPRRALSPSLVVLVALLLALALPVTAQRACGEVDCSKICNAASFEPQNCDRCCSDTGLEAMEGRIQAMEEGIQAMEGGIQAMEGRIHELRVMVGVVLALVVILLLAMVVVFLRHTSTRAIKAALPVFFRRRKDEARASIEKRPLPPTKVPKENRNSTVVRIADYQNNHSPLNKRIQLNGQALHGDSTLPNFPPPGDLPRTRQPSESTCPDDSTDLPHGHQHAYDNLALSTSTLHDTTTSSASTLGPGVSTNTLDTTLPSMNPTTPVLG